MFPSTMYVIRYYNAIENVQGRIVGVAENVDRAKKGVENYFNGAGEWRTCVFQNLPTYIRHVNAAAGIMYVVQEVEVL